MIDVGEGDVVLMTSFKAWSSNATVSFNSPRGSAAMFLLIGTHSKSVPISRQIIDERLSALGLMYNNDLIALKKRVAELEATASSNSEA